MIEPLAQLTGIDKSFAGHAVLENVDFDLRPGEVHVLAGENGAGKTTLIKILGGVHSADRGVVRIEAGDCRFRSVQDAARAGVAVIHQELSLALALSIEDNLFLGRERAGPLGVVRVGEQRREARALLARVGLDADPRATVGSLPIASRQLVEIAKALSQNARIIAMDEPTSSLSQPEAERLFALIGELSAAGAGIIYITHRMEEIYRIADRISVLRDGRMILTKATGDLDRAALVRAMVGRDVDERVHRVAVEPGEELLAVASISMSGRAGPVLDGVGLSLRAGEVLGIAGLAGSGASHLLHALFGDGRAQLTGLRVGGLAARIGTPRQAMAHGIALLTADRKRTGLCLSLSVADNATLAALRRLSPFGWRRPQLEAEAAARSITSLRVSCRSAAQSVRTLSGGNQQKVALAKWVETRPRVFLLDEPTRGIDVGAKQEIYELIDRWAADGMGIVLVSSEVPELLGLADRLIVLHRGRITAELTRDEATPERVVAAALGGAREGDAA
ncbi:MAG: sugar ABC transporter ATP-binding protein [Planctomycetota bacterium]|jgi:ABC-type sugar transport system ATPase subunit